jgi:hypothetical protein
MLSKIATYLLDMPHLGTLFSSKHYQDLKVFICKHSMPQRQEMREKNIHLACSLVVAVLCSQSCSLASHL